MKKALLILGILVFGSLFAATVMADTSSITSGEGANIKVYGPIDHYAVIDSSDWGLEKDADLTWKHPAWPIIEDAKWISSNYYTEEPRPDSWRMFSAEIVLPECATDISGGIKVTSDNAEEVYLNGTLIGSDGEVQGIAHDNQEWKTILGYDLTGLHAGTNDLKIIVRNYAYNTNSPNVNPTGLIYKGTITYNDIGDSDNDGVCDYEDMCLEREEDTPTEGLGVNRWIWNGNGIEWTKGDVPGKGKGPQESFTMKDTYGCSCFEILDKIKEKTGSDLTGHYKFGCSKSIIEDWIAGRYHLETVEVPSDESIASASVAINPAQTYILKASGTYGYANWAGNPIADAKCSYRGTADPLGFGPIWVSGDDLPSPYTNYLEVRVNDNVVDWGVPSGTCNSDNIYEMEQTGADHFDFNIYDGGAIGDNDGNILVDIFAKLW